MNHLEYINNYDYDNYNNQYYDDNIDYYNVYNTRLDILGQYIIKYINTEHLRIVKVYKSGVLMKVFNKNRINNSGMLRLDSLILESVNTVYGTIFILNEICNDNGSLDGIEKHKHAYMLYNCRFDNIFTIDGYWDSFVDDYVNLYYRYDKFYVHKERNNEISHINYDGDLLLVDKEIGVDYDLSDLDFADYVKNKYYPNDEDIESVNIIPKYTLGYNQRVIIHEWNPKNIKLYPIDHINFIRTVWILLRLYKFPYEIIDIVISNIQFRKRLD